MEAEHYMQRAIKLAKKGRGQVSPNPLVGAVIVKDDEIIGEGYHQAAGEAHAEVNALQKAGAKAKEATLYVNLEPCNHYGKTPPCTEAILEADIKKVVVAQKDPNPEVAGNGIEFLRQKGVEVETGLLQTQAYQLNEVFNHFMTSERPFVVLKNAVTLDGKIATRTGDSKWISGKQSRQLVHKLRNWLDGILVGIGTVLEDNPRLTTRLPNGGTDPSRIILDNKLRLQPSAQIIKQDSPADTIVATTGQASIKKQNELQKAGVKIIEAGEKKVDLSLLMKKLKELKITSLLVEGGSRVNTSFWEAELVDKLYYFIAPRIIGGESAVPVVSGKGVDTIKQGVEIKDKDIREIGDDILVTGYPQYN